jgi:hypothetical protein
MHRPHLLRSAFTSVRDLLAITIILNVVSHFVIFQDVHPCAAVLLGPVMIAVPYSISRDLANRIDRGRTRQAPVIHHPS